MRECMLEVSNNLGLHARAAGVFCDVASRFGCRVQVALEGGDWVDAKSVLALMLLAATKGTRLRLQVDGADERQAEAAIKQLFADRFGEAN